VPHEETNQVAKNITGEKVIAANSFAVQGDLNIGSTNEGQRTVRLDRASGLLRLQVPVGDYVEIRHQSCVVRVSVEEIVERQFSFSGCPIHARGCHLKVDTGGGLVFSGSDCEKTRTNEFIVPTKQFQDEEPVSV